MAGKVVKNACDAHRITIKCDMQNGEILLVRGGTRAYLWVGVNGECATHVSGTKTLRALAYAILDEVGYDAARQQEAVALVPVPVKEGSC